MEDTIIFSLNSSFVRYFYEDLHNHDNKPVLKVYYRDKAFSEFMFIFIENRFIFNGFNSSCHNTIVLIIIIIKEKCFAVHVILS